MQLYLFKGTVLVFIALFLSASFVTDTHAQAATADLPGDWVGGYKVDGIWHFVEAHFETSDDDLLAGLDFRFDMNSVTFADEVASKEDKKVLIALEKDEAPLVFKGQLTGDEINGEVTHGNASGDFVLTRTHDLNMDVYKEYIGNYQLGERLILLYSMQDFDWYYYFDTVAQRDVRLYPLAENRFFSELGETIEIVRTNDGGGASLNWHNPDGTTMSAPRAYPYSEEEVRYRQGDITLTGTLLLPDTPGPHPAIVLMHSTMPQNRDHFRRWGHYFAASGIAVLVYDKPGAFDSGHPSLGSFWENSVQSLADAALAGVHYLQSRPEINPQQVGIRTFSNSSWAGPLAAAQSGDVAFLIGTAVSGVAQRQADIFQIDLNNIGYYDYPDWAAASALAYVRFTREFSIFARELKLPLPAPYRDYYGVDFDPLTAWADIVQPVLVVNGQYDTLVDPVDAVARIGQTLAANEHSDYTLVIYPDTDHGLRKTDTGLIAEAQGERDRVLAPGIMALETEWVASRFDGQHTMPMETQEVRSPGPVQISTHFEAGGPYELLPWHGRSVWQLTLFALFVLVFVTAVIAIPIAVLIRALRHHGPRSMSVRWAHGLAWGGLMLLIGLILTWVTIVHMQIGSLWGFPDFLVRLPLVAILSVALIIAYLAAVIRAWRAEDWTRAGKVTTVIFGATSLLFVWYLGYWHLLIG